MKKPAKCPVNILVSQSFESFEQLADVAVSWQADFRQLDAEKYKASVFQAQMGSMLISNARFGCHVKQQGTSPEGMRTFAVFDTDAPPANWFGHDVGSDDLLIFPASGEIDVISRPGFGAYTFSLPENSLNEWFVRHTEYDLEKLLGSDEKVIQMPVKRSNRLRKLLQTTAQAIQYTGGVPSNFIKQTRVEEQLTRLLCEALTDSEIEPKELNPGGHYSLKRVLDYLHTHSDEALSVSELCAIARVSERTLQYLFRREVGMTPKSYVSGQRLYGAHRELWRTEVSATSVSVVANNWGFSHLGQFAVDYRRLFGELPSSTLKRPTEY